LNGFKLVLVSVKILKVVRDQLLSIQPGDLSNDQIIIEKATPFFALFGALQHLEKFKVTQTRKHNLADKRHEKRNPLMLTSLSDVVWVGPPAPPLSAEETKRIASISDPKISSGGAKHFHATQEQDTQLFGNLFCITTLRLLFLGGNRLQWIEGRSELPVLEWRHRYSPLNSSLSQVPSQPK
jgi:hypothetical protein